MEVDLYQRRGLYGLGDDAAPVDPAFIPAPSGFTSSLSTLTGALSTGPTPTMSWSTLGLIGIGAWFLLSAVGRGTSRVYQKVAKPIKKRRKRRQELDEAEDSYRRKRKTIERAYSK